MQPTRLCLLGLIALTSCSKEVSLTVTGELTYQGASVPGEISFEPLGENGKSVGRAVSIAVPETGRFRASLPSQSAEPQPFRLTVRVAPPSVTGTTINATEFGARTKTVPLHRELRNNQTLNLVITQ